MIPVTATNIGFVFDPICGFLRDLAVTDHGRTVSPMHAAPWVDTDEVFGDDIAPHLKRMSGDFFCAPFASSEGDSPMHGWPANEVWQVTAADGPVLQAALGKTVFGARLTKELRLIDDHPFVYQRHVFAGGAGVVSVANHAMVSLLNGGLMRFSPKRWFETAAARPESDPAVGRSALAYPTRNPDPRKVPLANGGTADVTRYPFVAGHEDFIVGVEAPGHALGWTAVTRPVEGDLYLSLRHAQRLPMTMMWHSDRGRDYAPWNGRHAGCLGVEEGAAVHMLGLGATETPDPLTSVGQSPGLTLNPQGTAEVRHVIGAIAWPSGEAVADIRAEGHMLVITGEGGARREVPFDAAFLS
ncbi:MAG: hypothetical protein JJT81_00690 [Rubellimicrobium sp.]|nr:hypothetical protein [Rubellimicrobium sp.]